MCYFRQNIIEFKQIDDSSICAVLCHSSGVCVCLYAGARKLNACTSKSVSFLRLYFSQHFAMPNLHIISPFCTFFAVFFFALETDSANICAHISCFFWQYERNGVFFYFFFHLFLVCAHAVFCIFKAQEN